MNKHFVAVIRSLEPALRRLRSMPPVTVESLPKQMPKAGVYLFSEGARHLYVGRSNGLRARIQRHSRPSATEQTAALAFRLAREATGKLHATYQAEGSRRDLMKNSEFRRAFQDAKLRIRRMDVRFVGEGMPTRRAVLEIYAVLAVNAKYNDFEVH